MGTLFLTVLYKINDCIHCFQEMKKGKKISMKREEVLRKSGELLNLRCQSPHVLCVFRHKRKHLSRLQRIRKVNLVPQLLISQAFDQPEFGLARHARFLLGSGTVGAIVFEDVRISTHQSQNRGEHAQCCSQVLSPAGCGCIV